MKRMKWNCLGKAGLLAIAISLVICLPCLAGAALFDMSGYISYANDVVRHDFALTQDMRDVRIWTDSYVKMGQNFDPVLELWDGEGNLIVENDDVKNSPVVPPQNYFDAGISLPSLKAGSYVLTVVAAPNAAWGNILADGFYADYMGWNNPIGDDSTYGGSGYYHVVADASVPTPLPSAFLLFGSGFFGLGVLRKKFIN